jgi:hypothetical protein
MPIVHNHIITTLIAVPATAFAAAAPDYPYPRDDEFYGSALLMGGYGRGYR